MSNLSDAYDIRVQQYLHGTAFIILFWDHFCTFDAEVRYIWQKPKRFATWMFLINRYTCFLGNIPTAILDHMDLPPDSCSDYNFYRQVLIAVNAVTVAALMTMRVYALFNCNQKVLYSMCAVFVSLTSVAVWALFADGNNSALDAPQKSCCACIAFPVKTSIRLATSSEAVLVYDIFLLILTIYITIKRWRPESVEAGGGAQMPLVTLLLRDGAAYFTVMVFANLSNILTFYLAGPYLRGCLSVVISNISVTVMSRMVLNLCEWAEEGTIVRTTASVQLGPMAFAHPRRGDPVGSEYSMRSEYDRTL